VTIVGTGTTAMQSAPAIVDEVAEEKAAFRAASENAFMRLRATSVSGAS
jgi:cation diffusion facilitator CzcD-associated flavoprotein CzcO